MIKFSRSAVFAAVSSVALASFAMAADPITLTAGASFINDHDLSNPGVTMMQFDTSLTPYTIDSVTSVSLISLSHPAAGDLDASLIFIPDNPLDNPIQAYLFAGLNDGFFLKLCDFDGTYDFSNSSTTELQAATLALGTNDSVPGDSYIPASYYNAANPVATVDLSAALGGIDLSTGLLYLMFEDFQPGNDGLIAGAELSLMVNGVPEPTSLAALSVIGAVALRRRSR